MMWAGEILHTGTQAHVLQNLSRIQGILADLVGQLDIFQSSQIGHQISRIILPYKAYGISLVRYQLSFCHFKQILSIYDQTTG